MNAKPARARILDTASALFYAHGIRAVGVDRIIAESGVAKATLYAHFPSKDDLVLTYLRASDTEWRSHLAAAAQAAGDRPRQQLIGMFEAVRLATTSPGFRGCAFLNAASESEPGSPVHQAVVDHKRTVRLWVRGLADAAGATDPDELATQLTLLIDGAMSAGAIDPTPKVAAAALSAAQLLVNQAPAHEYAM